MDPSGMPLHKGVRTQNDLFGLPSISSDDTRTDSMADSMTVMIHVNSQGEAQLSPLPGICLPLELVCLASSHPDSSVSARTIHNQDINQYILEVGLRCLL